MTKIHLVFIVYFLTKNSILPSTKERETQSVTSVNYRRNYSVAMEIEKYNFILGPFFLFKNPPCNSPFTVLFHKWCLKRWLLFLNLPGSATTFSVPWGITVPGGVTVPQGITVCRGIAVTRGITVPWGITVPLGITVPWGITVPCGITVPGILRNLMVLQYLGVLQYPGYYDTSGCCGTSGYYGTSGY